MTTYEEWRAVIELASVTACPRCGGCVVCGHADACPDPAVEITGDPGKSQCAIAEPPTRFWGEHPAHPTCIDVTGTDQTPRSEWACGPECPKEA